MDSLHCNYHSPKQITFNDVHSGLFWYVFFAYSLLYQSACTDRVPGTHVFQEHISSQFQLTIGVFCSSWMFNTVRIVASNDRRLRCWLHMSYFKQKQSWCTKPLFPIIETHPISMWQNSITRSNIQRVFMIHANYIKYCVADPRRVPSREHRPSLFREVFLRWNYLNIWRWTDSHFLHAWLLECPDATRLVNFHREQCRST